MPESAQIAAVFKRLRRERGLTQETVAGIAGLEVTGYRPYEYGQRQLDTDRLRKFTRAFGMTASELGAELGISPPTEHEEREEPDVYTGVLRVLGDGEDAKAIDQSVQRLKALDPEARLS